MLATILWIVVVVHSPSAFATGNGVEQSRVVVPLVYNNRTLYTPNPNRKGEHSAELESHGQSADP